MNHTERAVPDRQMVESGRKVNAADLREGDEIMGVGVMEADAEPLGSTHVRLYVAGCIYDKPATALLAVS